MTVALLKATMILLQATTTQGQAMMTIRLCDNLPFPDPDYYDQGI
jgi:hypothetical protein